MKKNKAIVLFYLLIVCSMVKGESGISKPPGTPITHSPKSTGKYIGSPSIVILPNGDYLTSHDFFGPACKEDITHVYNSKDKGKNWEHIATIPDAFWAGLFVRESDVYLLGVNGNSRNLAIWKSTDSGKTWSTPSILRKGIFHGSTTPILKHNGRIYKGYDHLGIEDKQKPWMAENKSFIMSAPIDADLMCPENWTYTNEVVKPDSMDGTGWLETNVVIGRTSQIKGITRLQNESGMSAGIYTLKNDSTIDMSSLSTIPFIGGATKFNILWDSKTKKYWSITNYPPDIIRAPRMRAGGMRSVLTLISSPDLTNWDINAILIASENITYHGFQYVDWCFDGKDIIYVSRTGFDDEEGGAERAHDANFLTFHRIKNYKASKTPKKYRYLLPQI